MGTLSSEGIPGAGGPVPSSLTWLGAWCRLSPCQPLSGCWNVHMAWQLAFPGASDSRVHEAESVMSFMISLGKLSPYSRPGS